MATLAQQLEELKRKFLRTSTIKPGETTQQVVDRTGITEKEATTAVQAGAGTQVPVTTAPTGFAPSGIPLSPAGMQQVGIQQPTVQPTTSGALPFPQTQAQMQEYRDKGYFFDGQQWFAQKPTVAGAVEEGKTAVEGDAQQQLDLQAQLKEKQEE